MSGINAYFRTAALVYFSGKSLSLVTKLLSDQGIAVRPVDGRKRAHHDRQHADGVRGARAYGDERVHGGAAALHAMVRQTEI